jgi:hypothetical protein
MSPSDAALFGNHGAGAITVFESEGFNQAAHQLKELFAIMA